MPGTCLSPLPSIRNPMSLPPGSQAPFHVCLQLAPPVSMLTCYVSACVSGALLTASAQLHGSSGERGRPYLVQPFSCPPAALTESDFLRQYTDAFFYLHPISCSVIIMLIPHIWTCAMEEYAHMCAHVNEYAHACAHVDEYAHACAHVVEYTHACLHAGGYAHAYMHVCAMQYMCACT